MTLTVMNRTHSLRSRHINNGQIYGIDEYIISKNNPAIYSRYLHALTYVRQANLAVILSLDFVMRISAVLIKISNKI